MLLQELIFQGKKHLMVERPILGKEAICSIYCLKEGLILRIS